jgi:MFS family permease
MVAILMMALPASSMLGSQLSAALLNFDGLMNLRGWHWLFIIEGLPAVLLGLVVPAVLPRQPTEARWLSSEEKEWLRNAIAQEQHDLPSIKGGTSLFSPRVVMLTLIYLGGTGVTNGLAFWQPQIIRTYTLLMKRYAGD